MGRESPKIFMALYSVKILVLLAGVKYLDPLTCNRVSLPAGSYITRPVKWSSKPISLKDRVIVFSNRLVLREEQLVNNMVINTIELRTWQSPLLFIERCIL
jgi:hypothetical protein